MVKNVGMMKEEIKVFITNREITCYDRWNARDEVRDKIDDILEKMEGTALG